MIIFKICCVLFAINFIITIICGALGFWNYNPYKIRWYDKLGLLSGGSMIVFAIIATVVRLFIWISGV